MDKKEIDYLKTNSGKKVIKNIGKDFNVKLTDADAKEILAYLKSDGCDEEEEI